METHAIILSSKCSLHCSSRTPATQPIPVPLTKPPFPDHLRLHLFFNRKNKKPCMATTPVVFISFTCCQRITCTPAHIPTSLRIVRYFTPNPHARSSYTPVSHTYSTTHSSPLHSLNPAQSPPHYRSSFHYSSRTPATQPIPVPLLTQCLHVAV